MESQETYRANHYENRAEYLKMLMETIRRKTPALYAALASTPANMPADVLPEHWSYDYVARAINAGIINGGGTFRAQDRILRVEVAKMSVEALRFMYGIPLENAVYQPFADIDGGEWYVPYVQTGVKLNLWHGENGNFYPIRWLPRKWSAGIITRILDYTPGNPLVGNSSGTIFTGEMISNPISLYGFSMPIIARVTWPGSDLDLRITTPSGRVLDPNSDIVAEFYEGPVEDYYVINSEEEGIWQIDIIGVEVDPEGEPYEFTVTVGEKQAALNNVDMSFVVPEFTIVDGNGDGFSETLQFKPGLITLVNPSTDNIFGDAGYETVAFADMFFDPNSYVSATSYDFVQSTYADGFSVYDDDQTFLLSADLTVSSLMVDGGTGAINPAFNVNLTNIEAAADYDFGTSGILDAFLTIGTGALNMTLQFAGDNLGWRIEHGEDVFGTVSGSAETNPVPEPGTMLLIGSGLTFLLALKRRKSQR